MNKPINKCSFCQYFLANRCQAANPTTGTVSPYYCRQAQYEYSQWLKTKGGKK